MVIRAARTAVQSVSRACLTVRARPSAVRGFLGSRAFVSSVSSGQLSGGVFVSGRGLFSTQRELVSGRWQSGPVGSRAMSSGAMSGASDDGPSAVATAVGGQDGQGSVGVSGSATLSVGAGSADGVPRRGFGTSVGEEASAGLADEGEGEAGAACVGSGGSGVAGPAAWLGTLSSRIPSHVRIVEVGPRDGLQNLKTVPSIPVETKIKLIEMLAYAGIKTIEAGAFVSPQWVPMMAGSEEVLRDVISRPEFEDISFPVLVPNPKGLERAIEAGAKEVAVFTAASESFCEENTNCSIEESLERCRAVCEQAIPQGVRVRGYVSCVLGCPYEGEIDYGNVAYVTDRLLEMGCYEVSLGDTTGVGTPGSTAAMLSCVLERSPVEKLAVHFHDTYGQALANVSMAVQFGIAVVDSSVGGLGGCPYARGASGNVATEDIVYMLQGFGIETGIDLTRLCQVGHFITGDLQAPYMSRVGRAAGQRQGFRRTRTFVPSDGSIKTRYLAPTVPRKRVSQQRQEGLYDELF